MATSAQNSLGSTLTEKFPIEKAKRDLYRAIHSKQHFHDHACNVAVSIAAALEWIYHLSVKGSPNWIGIKDEREFSNIVSKHNKFFGFMRDWSNEFKHAHRTKASTLFAKFDFVCHEENSPGSSGDLLVTGAIQHHATIDPVTQKRSYFVPTIRDVDVRSPSYSFTYVAQQAIAFLEAFDASVHSPNSLP